MLASTLFRCNRSNLANFKSLILKQDHTIFLKSANSIMSSERCYSIFSNKENVLVSKVNNTFIDKRFVSIPPKNQKEFDEFLDAFKKELQKFSLNDLKQSPKQHLAYGVGGLVPFVLPPIQMLMFGYFDSMAWLQLAYGATILSYLGGVQWGATIPDSSKTLPSWESLGLSVAPQLVAWIALLFPTPLGLLTTSTALTATLAMDLLKHNYPPWFKSLRIFLTLGAVSSLMLTFFGSIVA